MGLQMQTWESTLLTWAYHALDNHTPVECVPANTDALSAAYAHCEEVTRVNSRTFFMASSLLPEEKRLAVRALYAFCRVTDDIIDEGKGPTRLALLETWRELSLHPTPPEAELVALAWADTRARFNIPNGYIEQLIDGVSRDLTQNRYETFDDLAAYSYGVASTVGLMAMHIIGFSSEDAIPYAVRLGVALQITNILRDIGEDWQMGRLYLPQEELRAFDLTETDIHAGNLDARWDAFMAFQIERVHNLYDEALPGLGLLNRDGRFAIAAAAQLYRAILTDIEANRNDVFTRRAHINTLGKLRRLPGIYWRSRVSTPA